MIVKYRAGKIPESVDEMALDNAGVRAITEYIGEMEDYMLHLGSQTVWNMVSEANSFIENMAPWTLAKEGNDELLDAVLAALARCLFRVTLLASPFLPTKVKGVLQALGVSGTPADSAWAEIEAPKLAGATVSRMAPLFPKEGVATT